MTLPELATVLVEARRLGIAREKAALLVVGTWSKIQRCPIPGLEAWLRDLWPPDATATQLDLAAEPGAWRPVFLAGLSAGHGVERAANLAGVTRGAAYKARWADHEFLLAWEAAVLDGRRRRRASKPPPASC